MSSALKPEVCRRIPRPLLAGCLWLVVLLLGSVTGSATAQDSLTLTTNHYRVTGSTLREIRQSINRARPGGEQARTDALTEWKIEWRTRAASSNGECRLTRFETTTQITITLPSWQPPTNAAPAVMKRWIAYYTALQKHEANHVKTGTLAAQTLRSRITEVGPDSDCDRLQQRVRDVGAAVIAEFKQRDADYDRETDHGRKEGATLP